MHIHLAVPSVREHAPEFHFLAHLSVYTNVLLPSTINETRKLVNIIAPFSVHLLWVTILHLGGSMYNTMVTMFTSPGLPLAHGCRGDGSTIQRFYAILHVLLLFVFQANSLIFG